MDAFYKLSGPKHSIQIEMIRIFKGEAVVTSVLLIPPLSGLLVVKLFWQNCVIIADAYVMKFE